MHKPTTLIRNEGEGENLWFAGGGVFTMLATTAETNGSFMMFEDRVVRGKMTPMHLHPDIDELCYILEGEMIVHVDGVEQTVRKGGLFFAPRGTPHSFMITSETAHLLCLQTPGHGEAFYRSVSDAASSPVADAARPPDIARLQAGAAKSKDIQLLGPPPFKR